MTDDNYVSAPATEAEMTAILGKAHEEQYFDNSGEVRNPVTGRIIRGGDYGESGDQSTHVEFFLEAFENKLETYRQGRKVFTDVEHVRYRVPGDQHTSMVAPVTEFHKWRWPVDYANWKKGLGALVTGTPLKLFPGSTPSLLKELEHMGVTTIEQLAGLPDSAAGQLRGFYQLKQKAGEYITAASKNAGTTQLQSQLDDAKKESDANAAIVQKLQSQVAQLLEIVQSQQASDEGDEEQSPVAEAVKKKTSTYRKKTGA